MLFRSVSQDQAVRLSDVVVLGGHARENLPTVLARALHRVINLRPTDWDVPRQVKVGGECLAALRAGRGREHTAVSGCCAPAIAMGT